MSVQVQRRRDTATFLSTYVGAQGELLVDTTNKVVQVHDGVTPGGFAAARADQTLAAPTGTSRVGDLFYGTGGTTSARLADVAVGSVLVSGGAGAAPAWSTALPTGMTIATPAAGDTSTKVANMAAVAAAIAALVASSPAALDTLKELADAINDDPNFATTITNLIATKAAKGANTDITSIAGLTTALTIAQGGTGATTAGAALASLGGATETAGASFAPTVTFATPGDQAIAYDSGGQVGYSYRVGKLVFVYVSLVFTPTYSSASGILRITGLPTSAGAGAQSLLSVLQFSGSTAITWPGGATQLNAQIPAGASYMQISGTKSGSTPATASTATCASGNKITLTLQGTYLSA